MSKSKKSSQRKKAVFITLCFVALLIFSSQYQFNTSGLFTKDINDLGDLSIRKVSGEVIDEGSSIDVKSLGIDNLRAVLIPAITIPEEVYSTWVAVLYETTTNAIHSRDDAPSMIDGRLRWVFEDIGGLPDGTYRARFSGDYASGREYVALVGQSYHFNVGFVDAGEGIPEEFEGAKIEVSGKISGLPFEFSNKWDYDKTPPVLPPVAEEMTVALASHPVEFGYAKLVLTDSEGLTTEVPMTLQFGLKLFFTLVTIDSWWEATLDLSDFESGEYRVDVVGRFSSIWYTVASFDISVRTLPTAWIAQNVLMIGAIGVGFIFIIVALREVRGWWGFKGKYRSV